MAENNIDIFGITETNLNTNDPTIYHQLTKESRKHLNDNNAHITASATKTSTKTKYKPGGTAIITTQHITSQTMLRDYDHPYGRWTTIVLGPPNHQVAIITAYIVCNTQIHPTKTKTAAYQQWLLMCANNFKGHPRKKAI